MFGTAMRLVMSVVRVVASLPVVERPACLAALCGAAILTVGCGQGSSSSLPTAPTGTVAGLAAEGPGLPAPSQQLLSALKGGNGHSNDGNRGRGGDGWNEVEKVDESANGVEHGRRGMLSGFVTDVGDDWIEIRGIRVNISEDTIIRHGHRILEIDDIHEGDHAQARGILDDSALEATEIKVQDTGKDNDDEDEEEDEDD